MQSQQVVFNAALSPPSAGVSVAASSYEVWDVQLELALPLLGTDARLYRAFYWEIRHLLNAIQLSNSPGSGTSSGWRRSPTSITQQVQSTLPYPVLAVLEKVRVFGCGRVERIAFWAVPLHLPDYMRSDAPREFHGRPLRVYPTFDARDLGVTRDAHGRITSIQIMDPSVRDAFNLLQVLVPGLLALTYEETVVISPFHSRRCIALQYLPLAGWVAGYLQSLAQLDYPTSAYGVLAQYVARRAVPTPLPLRWLN